MGHGTSDIGQNTEIRHTQSKNKVAHSEDFVLEKSIFNNVFEKDIRRVFIYKKTERLAKALHLVTPAFAGSVSLRNRIDQIAIGLIDAAVQSPLVARATLSRDLLALSSILSIARTGGLLSPMNTEIIAHEAHILLQEIASYEEPRLLIDETVTLSEIAKSTARNESVAVRKSSSVVPRRPTAPSSSIDKGHLKDIRDVSDSNIKDRREAILSVMKNKASASIKDISTLIRDVSEKTIQRELTALIGAGIVVKQGERRWSTYSLINT